MESTSQQQSNRFVVEFISATDIPWFENRVKSDPSLQAYISTHVEKHDSNNRPQYYLERSGNTVTTPRRLDCTSVIWHCYRDFNTKPAPESILTIEIYHQGSHLLGKIDIPTRVLSHENPMSFPFYLAKVTLTVSHGCFGNSVLTNFILIPTGSAISEPKLFCYVETCFYQRSTASVPHFLPHPARRVQVERGAGEDPHRGNAQQGPLPDRGRHQPGPQP